MTKKRKMIRRRTYFRPKRSRSRSRSRGSSIGMGSLVSAGAYGALRERVAQQLDPILSNVPGGAIADEVGMLGVNWAVNKYMGNKIPMLKEVTKYGMIIEASNIGRVLATGGLSPTTTARQPLQSFR